MVKEVKPTKSEEKDSLGFKKKDYPIIGAVALLAANFTIFKMGNVLFTILIVLIDIAIGAYLMRKFLPKKKVPVVTAPVTQAAPAATVLQSTVVKPKPKRHKHKAKKEEEKYITIKIAK